jgi:farnesyl-diphosphate farnesyltransferase
VNSYDMLRNVSRTFSLSIEQLPGLQREAVTVAYLLFRVADCIEDHDMLDARTKAHLLRLWAGVLTGTAPVKELSAGLAGLDGSDPEVYVAQHAGSIMAHLQSLPATHLPVLVRHVHETSLGMARWQEHGPFVRDEAEMDDYMHEVAGRVGWLLTEVFALHSPAIAAQKDRLMELGREFGLALQTVNIIRGMRKDFERGWIFVPETFCGQAGLDSVQLFDPAHEPAALQVLGMLTAKARRHLDNGIAYIRLLPRGLRTIRLFCIWPLLFAARTLAISEKNPLVLRAEAKITRAEVQRIVGISGMLYWSNALLDCYYKRLLKKPAIARGV